MKQIESFFWDAVRDIINVDEHIRFAESLINKYDWNKKDKKLLTEQLSRIHAKQKDDCLNLSIIGEFASGKSSFINALLGEELLVSSALQGTTLVNTIIEYSEKPHITVVYKNSCDRKEYDKISDLCNPISQLTTDSVKAAKISYVIVGIPVAILKNHIRILDTPGTNSLESWHEDTTRRALKEVSDLSIILTDANHPLPQSLCSFIESNIGDILPQCAIAVTRIDLIREKEQVEILAYVKKKASLEFEYSEMFVFPFSAPALLGEIKSIEMVRNQQKMAALSRSSISKIFDHMAQKRNQAQIKKLLHLIQDAFKLLNSNISQKKNSCEKELQLLKKSQQAELLPFIKQQQSTLSRKFLLESKGLRSDLSTNCDNLIAVSKARIIQSIRDLNGSIADEVKQHMTETFLTQCQEESQKLNGCFSYSYSLASQQFNRLMNIFQENFNLEFQKLGILKLEFDTQMISAPKSVSVDISDIKSAMDYIKSEVSNDNFWMGGGAGVGAIIGSFIAPGIGTVIGAGLGVLFGAFGSTDIDKIKNSVITKIDTPLNSFFALVKNNTLDAYDQASDNLSSAICSEIERYLDKYQTTVSQRIIENKQRQQRVIREIESETADLNLISIHENQLNSSLAQI